MLYKSLRTGVLLGDFPNLFESIAALSVPRYEHATSQSTARHLRFLGQYRAL
jgi:hypothetical protein